MNRDAHVAEPEFAKDPEAQQADLFHAFRRTESVLRGSQKGRGIGLTLVRGLVHAHGGYIEVQSSATQGTTLTVQLPLMQG